MVVETTRELLGYELLKDVEIRKHSIVTVVCNPIHLQALFGGRVFHLGLLLSYYSSHLHSLGIILACKLFCTLSFTFVLLFVLVTAPHPARCCILHYNPLYYECGGITYFIIVVIAQFAKHVLSMHALLE